MPFLSISRLSKRYCLQNTTTAALSEISLEVDYGDIFGIIGKSGAGKSTLIRCLAGLEKPDEGEILVEGKKILQMAGKELFSYRHQIGMIFQHFNLLSSRTVAGNISYPLEIRGMPEKERKKRVDEVIELVGLQTKKDEYPARLSGGQKQRVGIARALAGRPYLLLCDEATSALDPQTTQEILSLLKELNQKLGLTIILITHEMEVIKQICNKVAVLEKGALVEVGTALDIFTHPKHPTTKQFLQKAVHEIPPYFFQKPYADRTLLRLTFRGGKGSEPIISRMVKQCDVDANILLGWLDFLEETLIGTLIIELTGLQERQQQALHFLRENQIHYEVLKNGYS